MRYFEEDFLEFFIELAANNHKEWFDDNRKRYEQKVKDPFKYFVQSLIEEIRKDDASVQIEAKDAIFRINRDIRFSKDKTPYKMNRSAVISAKGRKDHSIPGFYVSMGPEKLTYGGGSYYLPTAELAKVRDNIVRQSKKFSALVKDKTFVRIYGELQGEENKRLPNKELTAAAEKQPLLYRKQFYYMADNEPELILQENLMDIAMEHYMAARGMQTFLKASLNV